MRLYLVRHGQTAWNAAMKAQGHTDIPLDATGSDQARLLGLSFSATPIERVLSSDLRRSADTAAPVAASTGAPLELLTDLRERAFGDFEGLPFDQVAARMIEGGLREGLPPHAVRPPGGESLVDLWIRLETVVERLDDLAGPCVVVTHGGTCGVLLAKLLHGTHRTARGFRFANTSVTELERRPDHTWTIVRYNDTSHLQGGVLSGSVDGAGR
jgi:2,3-bisphosphoglycerate-dependent phosphoglycerate mutase